MPSALRNLRRGLGPAHFALNPVAVANGERGLRSNLLREEAVGCSRGHTPRRSMRLVEQSAVFQVGHDVADGRGAQGFFIPLGNGARGYRFAGLNVGAHEICKNLTVPTFL